MFADSGQIQAGAAARTCAGDCHWHAPRGGEASPSRRYSAVKAEIPESWLIKNSPANLVAVLYARPCGSAKRHHGVERTLSAPSMAR